MKQINKLHPKNRRSKRQQSLPNVIFRPKEPEPTADPHLSKAQGCKQVANIKRFTQLENHSDIEAIYDEMFGLKPMPVLTSINLVEQAHIETAIRRELKRLGRSPGMEIGLQLERFERVSGAEAVVDVKRLRARSRVYQKAGVSSISSIAFVDLPDPDDNAGFVIELQVRTILFGVNIKHDIELMKRAGKVARHPTAETILWIDPTDKEELKRAVAQVISPPLVGDPESRAAADRLGDTKWMKRAAAERAFVLLQIRSMLPMKDRLSSQGNGRAFLESAIKGAQTRVKQAAKGQKSALHKDGFVHFWFGELKRLGLSHLEVPLIQLR